MRRRVLAATAGGALGAVLLGAALVGASWRPSGPLAAVLLMGVVVPAVGGAGTAAGLWLSDRRDVWPTARLAALGTPILGLLALFTINAVAVQSRPGAQQVAALVIGTAGASALAARFTAAEG